MRKPSPYPNVIKDGSSPEYAPETLMEEFIDRAEENFIDPELWIIKALLRPLGFVVMTWVGEDEESKEEDDTATREKYHVYPARIRFISTLGRGEICKDTHVRYPQFPVFELTPQDEQFLHHGFLAWQ